MINKIYNKIYISNIFYYMINPNIYFKKYLFYKRKYLELQKAGDPTLEIPEEIKKRNCNLFTIQRR